MTIDSYGKVWKFDDAPIRAQFFGLDVEIEEKIDGSQFSAARINGEYKFRSKGVEVFADDAGMFGAAVESAGSLDLLGEHTYRFEYLSKPKHNTLSYERIPKSHLMMFEVQAPDGRYFKGDEVAAEADRLGLEHAPTLYSGPMPNMDEIAEMMDRISVLGKEKIEGVVIKARDHRHDRDGKVLKAKIVSDRFKERHRGEWKKTNPSQSNIVDAIGESLNTEARFSKVRYALRDRGELTGTPRDIGLLRAEFWRDLLAEEEDQIKDALFKWAWPKIQRRAASGLPQWYIREIESTSAD